MFTWLYDNPLGIAFTIVGLIFILSISVPANSWDRAGHWLDRTKDRILDRLWYSSSQDEIIPPGPPRPRMPWENNK